MPLIGEEIIFIIGLNVAIITAIDKLLNTFGNRRYNSLAKVGRMLRYKGVGKTKLKKVIV